MYYNLSAMQLKHKIRKINRKDISTISKIEYETYGKYGWSKEIFNNELTNDYARYFVFELTSNIPEVIGYIGCWIVNEEAHITSLVVSHKYRRIHVADKLLYSLIINMLKENIKWLTLEVRVSNVPAINLYKKFGFNQLGIRKKYYQDNNEDALILWSENIQSTKYKKLLNEIIIKINDEISNADKYQYSPN